MELVPQADCCHGQSIRGGGRTHGRGYFFDDRHNPLIDIRFHQNQGLISKNTSTLHGGYPGFAPTFFPWNRPTFSPKAKL